MTTLRKLQAQVTRFIEKGPRTKDSKLSPAYIQETIRQCAHKMLKAEHYQSMSDGSRDVNPVIIATYEVSVVNDTTRKRNYIVLPCFPINLPENHGVLQVKPLTGTASLDRAMIPISPFELELLGGSLAGAEIFKDQFTFELDRDKIWFSQKDSKTLLTHSPSITTVEVKQAVIDPNQVAEGDNFPVSPELEFDLIKETLLVFGYTGQEIHDMTNDGNPNTK